MAFNGQSVCFGAGLQFSEKVQNAVRIVSFRCPVLGGLRVAIIEGEQVFSYLSYEGRPWEAGQAQGFLGEQAARSLVGENCISSCRLWLDDWSELSGSKSKDDEITIDFACSLLDCKRIDTRVGQGDLTFESIARPSLIDTDASVLRIVDLERKQVIYADLQRVKHCFDGQVLESIS